MKTLVLIVGIMLSVVILGTRVMAEDAVKEPSTMVEVGNKICPVSGEKVGEMGDAYKVEHNGKTYNLCCSMCKKDFNNNVDKFSKVAEDEVAVVNN